MSVELWRRANGGCQHNAPQVCGVRTAENAPLPRSGVHALLKSGFLFQICGFSFQLERSRVVLFQWLVFVGNDGSIAGQLIIVVPATSLVNIDHQCLLAKIQPLNINQLRIMQLFDGCASYGICRALRRPIFCDTRQWNKLLVETVDTIMINPSE